MCLHFPLFIGGYYCFSDYSAYIIYCAFHGAKDYMNIIARLRADWHVLAFKDWYFTTKSCILSYSCINTKQNLKFAPACLSTIPRKVNTAF